MFVCLKREKDFVAGGWAGPVTNLTSHGEVNRALHSGRERVDRAGWSDTVTPGE